MENPDGAVLRITEFGTVEAPALPDHVSTSRAALQERLDDLDLEVSAARGAASAQQENRDRARTDHNRLESRSVLPNSGVTTRDLSASTATVKKENERLEAVSAKLSAILGKSNGQRDLLRSVDMFTNGRRTLKPIPDESGGRAPYNMNQTGPGESVHYNLKPAPDVRLPKGNLTDVVAEQRSKLGALRKELAKTEDAAETLEMAIATAMDEVDRKAAKANFHVRPGVGKRKLAVAWPKAINERFRDADSAYLQTTDVEGLLCAMFPDAIKAAIKASVEQAYEGLTTMEPHVQIRRIRELKAEILTYERIEAEAIWQLHRSGDFSVDFRPDTDPRAILGVM
jgi:hypothetical protein